MSNNARFGRFAGAMGIVGSGVVALLSVGCSSAPKPVTTATLLAEMTDLRGLTEYPDPPYLTRQFSSYDRASTSPANAETWFANGDAAQYLRTEQVGDRTEWVMMDAEGPGAIVRIWSANPGGTLRIYLDGSPSPVIAAPLADALGGRLPEVPPPMAGARSRGWNWYMPIPYAKHCKVTSDQGNFYYHVDYRTYPAGTAVQSFTRADFEENRRTIRANALALALPKSEPVERGEVEWRTVELAPGAETAIVELTGPRVITELTTRLARGDAAQTLRHLVLAGEFDGETTIAAPLGDFFGTAPGANHYRSLPSGVTTGGVLWSRWPMPFRERARLTLRNAGPTAAALRVSFSADAYAWTDRSMHFHAKWRAARGVPTRPMQDWNYLTAGGRGVFVGAAFCIANPVKIWWGEGDEKIYVDGETFPSHFGTGTEDYYGYAWCCNEPFMHGYHNQPRCDGPGNYGWTSVNRWHILDRIPFTRDFRFDMELWHWREGITVDMAVVAYWYARPGASDAFPPIRDADLPLRELPPYQPPRVAGAIEGEDLRVIESVGTIGPQDVDGCSAERHLWWRDGLAPGNRAVIAFPAAEGGPRRVWARFVNAPDYGIVQLAVNGRTAGPPLDGYFERVRPSAEIDLGVFDLVAGENRLAVDIVGKNEQARPGCMFGLDYLRIEPVAP